MRLVFPVLVSLTLAGVAFAQAAPRVTIEDDVSHVNALKCAGLRAAQISQNAAPDALLQATYDAWILSLRQAGHDVGKIKQDVDAEATQLAPSSAEAKTAMAQGCTPFEIRAAG
jgi:invasion protein IalB